MKTFEIKTLMFVAAVACLPIACGTSSVTGPDAASLAGPESTVSALYNHPLPPTAPEAPSPHSVPVPGSPTGDDVKDEHPGTTHVIPVPVPAGNPGTPPSAPQCLAASVEFGQTTSFFAGYPSVSLVATVRDEKGVAITDSSCDAIEWSVQASSGDSGNTPPVGSPSLVVETDRHFATLYGPAGDYKVGATAPNGQSGSRLVTLIYY